MSEYYMIIIASQSDMIKHHVNGSVFPFNQIPILQIENLWELRKQSKYVNCYTSILVSFLYFYFYVLILCLTCLTYKDVGRHHNFGHEKVLQSHDEDVQKAHQDAFSVTHAHFFLPWFYFCEKVIILSSLYWFFFFQSKTIHMKPQFLKSLLMPNNH